MHFQEVVKIAMNKVSFQRAAALFDQKMKRHNRQQSDLAAEVAEILKHKGTTRLEKRTRLGRIVGTTVETLPGGAMVFQNGGGRCRLSRPPDNLVMVIDQLEDIFTQGGEFDQTFLVSDIPVVPIDDTFTQIAVAECLVYYKLVEVTL